MTINLPSSGKANNFAWTTNMQTIEDADGHCNHAIREFKWNNTTYKVTVHNPNNLLSRDQMSQAIDNQIDKIVILTERYLHRKSVDSFECNAQLNELKRFKKGANGAKIPMPVVQNPLDALNTRKKDRPANDPVPPHIQNALALYDQVKKQAAPGPALPMPANQAQVKVDKQAKANETPQKPEVPTSPAAAAMPAEQAEIKNDKPAEADETMKLADKKKKDDKPKVKVELGPFGTLYSWLRPGLKAFYAKVLQPCASLVYNKVLIPVYNKVLQPCGLFLYQMGRAIREKIFGPKIDQEVATPPNINS